MIGTTTLDICPTCGNHTMDEDGYCHYAYCGDDYDEEEESAFKYETLN